MATARFRAKSAEFASPYNSSCKARANKLRLEREIGA
jgi:hypothetical protein